MLLLHGGGEEGCSIYLGGIKFPAMDPPAVGADISMGARVCCLIEMQMRTFLGLASSDFTPSEVTQVWSLSSIS